MIQYLDSYFYINIIKNNDKTNNINNKSNFDNFIVFSMILLLLFEVNNVKINNNRKMYSFLNREFKLNNLKSIKNYIFLLIKQNILKI